MTVTRTEGGNHCSNLLKLLMDFRRICLWAALLIFISNCGGVGAGDIVHDDDMAPKKPGCENDFVLVNFAILLSFYSDMFSGLSLFHKDSVLPSLIWVAGLNMWLGCEFGLN